METRSGPPAIPPTGQPLPNAMMLYVPQPPAHDSDEYAGWTETQLVRQVAGHAGAPGAGAAAELQRRLMMQLAIASHAATSLQERLMAQGQEAAARADKQGATLIALTKWLIGLTVGLVGLTVVLVILTLVLLAGE